MSNGGGRVTIPRSMRQTIENIKEIARSHGDEEIYLMLKECNMDPNETAQKLLFQDTFHEVKRKRDRKKENIKESTESRGKEGIQMNRGGRGNFTARYSTDDAGGGGRNSVSVRENGSAQVPANRVGISTFSTSQDIKNKEASNASSSTVIIDASVGLSSENTSAMHATQSVTAPIDVTKLEDRIPNKSPAEANKTVTEGTHVQLMPSPSNLSTSGTSVPSSGVYFSHSKPVLVLSQDLRLLGAKGTTKHDTGNQQTTSQLIPVTPAESKPISVSSEVGSSFMSETVPKMSQVACQDQLSESSQAINSTHCGPPVSKSLSNYGGRSPQVIGPQKVVGPSKEWKAKPTNPNLAQGPDTALELIVPTVSVEAVNYSLPAVGVIDAKQTSSELEKKLQESHISGSQHVIIPNHLHVPEVEKLGFCFGSFDANFGLNTSCSFHTETEKSTSLSETSDAVEENLEGTSNQNDMVNIKEKDYPPSSSHVPESLISSADDVSSTAIPEYSESKQEKTDLSPGSQQYSAVHTFPNYNLGLMPPVIPPISSNESQNRDFSLPPSFVVQQPFDSTSYYAQFYRSSADSDDRISPFHAPVISTEFSGNMTVLPPQASQSSQEAGNNLILPTAGPTPLETEAAGVMQSSIAGTQQPLPVFRQPAGMYLPHYPNYIPYAHYYPFYVPPPAMHQFLSNGVFPPSQAQVGSVYPAPPVSTNKYSLPQYKPGSNTGNSNHMGMSDSYGPYGSSPASFNPSSATTTELSTSSEDLVATQLKENGLFSTGQQTEGPAVWIPAPGRDISGLQASSFYNLPQAQVAFTATQGNHGSFTGIYHPSQPVTGAAVHPLLQQSPTMAGPTASVYQPSQPAPINWTNNY